MNTVFNPFSSVCHGTGNPSLAGGFTLLELMIVVFILSALAFSATSVLDEQDSTRINEARKNETARRLDEIRDAVLGDPAPENGIFKFVSDMGRLPATDNLRELFEKPSDCGSGSEPCDWKTDAKSGLSYGWRGPYLKAPYEADGKRYFRDGWGNSTETAALSRDGWKMFERDNAVNGAGSLTVQGYGSDGRAGGAGYAADDPPNEGGQVVPLPLLKAEHYQFNAAAGTDWNVRFYNPADSSGAKPSADTVLRLKLHFPKDGRPDFFQSSDITLNPIADGQEAVRQFSFPVDTKLSWGGRTLVIECANGNPFDGDCNTDNVKSEPVTLKPNSSPESEIQWELQ